MCQELEALRAAMTRLARVFDPIACSPSHLSQVVADASAVAHMATTVATLAAARAAEVGAWRGKGQRSPAHYLAQTAGTGVSRAGEALEVGRRLGELPEVDRAARAGLLSEAQVAAITAAATVRPDAASALVEVAARSSLPELRDECARVRAAAVDQEERHRQVHATRRLRSWSDVEGRWHLRAEGTPEAGAQIMAALAPRADEGFSRARSEGRREPPEAYVFDALVDLATAATSVGELSREDGGGSADGPAATFSRERVPRARRGAPVKLLVRVDWDTFLRGYPLEGETCELVGFGPVPVSVVHRLVAEGDPFVAAILTRGKALVGVAHLGRRPTAHQRSALEWLYPSCAAEGCPSLAHLEMDHRVDWARSHITVLDHLDRLCRAHHRLKTREGWSLVSGTGKRAFVPPHDPRHPRHRRQMGSTGSGPAPSAVNTQACPDPDSVEPEARVRARGPTA